jgi:hypothetical protein
MGLKYVSVERVGYAPVDFEDIKKIFISEQESNE